MANEYELSFSDYLSIIRRRFPYLIGTFVVVLVIAIIVAFTLPPTYRSSGTIMVESSQVSEGVVPNSVRNDLDERINVIKQRVMTREGLLQLINKYDLFKGKAGTLTPNDLVEKMRNRIVVEPTNPGSDFHSNQQGLPTISFMISFEDSDAEVAYKVAKDLVTLFLDLNIKLATEGATETTDFLTQESDRLKTEVDQLEGKISAFKNENSENLPEQLNLRETMQSRSENYLYEVERDIRSGNEELRALEAELANAKHGVSDDPSQSLSALKAEYARLSTVYTESHPDLKALKHKIDALENGSAPATSKSATSNVNNLNEFKIQSSIDAVKARLESLEQEKLVLKDKISRNEHAMEITPGVSQKLEMLVRDRDSALKKYEEIRNKQMNAHIAQNLESENKSERFTLLEPPVLPEKPYKPDRTKILVMGFFLAIAASGGAVLFLESIDKRIRGSEAMTHVLGCLPLVVIPYIPIVEEDAKRKLMLKRVLIGLAAALFAAILALNFLYMPLGALFIKLLARIA
jgi:polysaccharide chain length determinant protein (PEP-CTERM system associated)